MDNIQRRTRVRRTALSEEFYLQSLLQEGYAQGDLSGPEVENVLMQCVSLLAKTSEHYNRSESSSVRVEVTQRIMASNLYTVGRYLKSLPDTASALESLRKEPVSELYRRGRETLDSAFHIAEQLYESVSNTRIANPNHAYNATIEEGIEEFFRLYDKDYGAHEAPASIDYQLLNPVIGLTGVEYMVQYLRNLHMENLFCSRFEDTIIDEVMRGYDAGYEDLLVNISGQVLQNALGCALLGKDVLHLSLTPMDIQQLRRDLQERTIESVSGRLQTKAEGVMAALGVSDPLLKEYAFSSLPEIASRICSGVETNTLHTVFVPRRGRIRSRVIRYSAGSKMDDERYRDIVKELLSCRYSQDKIQIIREHIRTLSDMEDIICDGELGEEEALSVFRMLPDTDVAAMVKRHPYSPDLEALGYPEAEIRLRRYLERYLETMPPRRLKRLHAMVQDIEEA